MEDKARVSVCVRTLVGNGFVLERVYSNPSYVVLDLVRCDEFGIQIPYRVVICLTSMRQETVKRVEKEARKDGHRLIFVADDLTSAHTSMSAADFLNRLGGPVSSWSVLEPGFAEALSTLGQNRLPTGWKGDPDKLFEDAVKDSLQFIFGSRVAQYGQQRLFESLPEGVVFPQRDTMVLYDCKAYEKGYPISRDDIRRFASYVKDFDQRYGDLLGPPYAFLVISHSFADSVESIQSRARQLFELCRVQLVAVTTQELAAAISLLAKCPAFRQAINWKAVLTSVLFDASDIEAELKRITEDGLVRRELARGDIG